MRTGISFRGSLGITNCMRARYKRRRESLIRVCLKMGRNMVREYIVREVLLSMRVDFSMISSMGKANGVR